MINNCSKRTHYVTKTCKITKYYHTHREPNHRYRIEEKVREKQKLQRRYTPYTGNDNAARKPHKQTR